jgi:hypothetical protein
MAFIKSAVRLIIKEHAAFEFRGPVLTLGVPEVYATYEEIQKWFPVLAQKPCLLQRDDVVISENECGAKLQWVTIGSFLHAFGIVDMTSVDIPGCEYHPGLIHDLNRPLQSAP